MTFRRYLLAQAFGIAAFNAVMNAGYTWFLWGSETHFPSGTAHLVFEKIGLGLAMTPIWIGLLWVLLGTAFIRKAFADGTILCEAAIEVPSVARWLPHGILVRSLVVAGICAAIFALPLWFFLPMAKDGLLTPGDAIGTKVVVTVLFSLIIVPLILYATAGDVWETATKHVRQAADRPNPNSNSGKTHRRAV